MLVRLHQTVYVTEHFQLGRFGQVVVSSGGRLRQPTADIRATDQAAVQAAQEANDLNQLIIDDADQAQNPDPIVFGRGGQPLSASQHAARRRHAHRRRRRPDLHLGGQRRQRQRLPPASGRRPGRHGRVRAGQPPTDRAARRSGPAASRSPAPTCSTSSTPSRTARSGRRAARPTAAAPTTPPSTSGSWPRRSHRCSSSAPTSSATWRWRTTATARPARCRPSSTPSTPPTARDVGVRRPRCRTRRRRRRRHRRHQGRACSTGRRR